MARSAAYCLAGSEPEYYPIYVVADRKRSFDIEVEHLLKSADRAIEGSRQLLKRLQHSQDEFSDEMRRFGEGSGRESTEKRKDRHGSLSSDN